MATLYDDVKVIDADTHFTEPPTCGRAARRPRTRTGSCTSSSATAVPTWVVDGAELGFAKGGGVVDHDGGKIPFLESMDKGIDWVHRGAWDPEARLQVMDECGIHAQVLFPNAVGLGGQHAQQHRAGRGAAAAVHRDLQRRHGRDAGRVEPPLPPDAGHAGVGRRPVREGDRTLRRASACAAST